MQIMLYVFNKSHFIIFVQSQFLKQNIKKRVFFVNLENLLRLIDTTYLRYCFQIYSKLEKRKTTQDNNSK